MVNVANEDSHLENLEKASSKNYNILSQQIGALRKAFNTLADVVMEELDSVKNDVVRGLEESNHELLAKVAELEEKIAHLNE